MNAATQNDPFLFIVGSPRSGTTVLGDILDRHTQISQWYEPYFVWDHHFRNWPHDERAARDATPRVRRQIYNDFLKYRKRTGSRIVVDKSPRNSLKIPFIRAIFENARFIHILRDGRDATLSIHREWRKRQNIIGNPQAVVNAFSYHRAMGVVSAWLKRQPFPQDKIRAFWHETHGHLFDKTKHLNRLRWKGRIGWGPRFKDWETAMSEHTLLQFNAYQWLKCTESIQQAWPTIPERQRLEIRYEDLITRGHTAIAEILEFIGLKGYDAFFDAIPKLKSNNFDKWKSAFSPQQKQEVLTLLSPLLIQLGYNT